jgi:hypothetical protein
MTERWLPVEGFPHYEVSDLGRVRRVVAVRGRAAGKLLSPGRGTYLNVGLHQDGRPKYFGVHQLVAQAFLGPKPSAAHQVAHCDGDRWNNIAPNLRWATPRENTHDKLRHGTMLQGEQVGTARLTASQIATVRRLYALGATQAELALLLGVGQNYISRIVSREIWPSVA